MGAAIGTEVAVLPTGGGWAAAEGGAGGAGAATAATAVAGAGAREEGTVGTEDGNGANDDDEEGFDAND